MAVDFVAGVHGHCERASRRGFGHPLLAFAHLCPRKNSERALRLSGGGQLHNQERKLAAGEAGAPRLDQGGQQGAILRGAHRVSLTLIPEHALDREGRERCHHAIMRHRGDAGLDVEDRRERVGGIVAAAGGRAPRAVEHDRRPGFGREQEVAGFVFAHMIGTVEKAALAMVEHADGDLVLARAQDAFRHGVNALAVAVGGFADEFAVDPHGVGRADFTKQEAVGFRCAARRQVEFAPQPGDPAKGAKTGVLPRAGQAQGFPSRVVELRSRPGRRGARAGVRALPPAAGLLLHRDSSRALGSGAIERGELGRETLDGKQALAGHPRLGGRTAPGALQEPDGHP